MAERSEVLTQLARVLGDDALKSADIETARTRASARLNDLASAVLEELVASDDVVDRESALFYLDRRLDFLGDVLGDDLISRLREAVALRLAAW